MRATVLPWFQSMTTTSSDIWFATQMFPSGAWASEWGSLPTAISRRRAFESVSITLMLSLSGLTFQTLCRAASTMMLAALCGGADGRGL